MKDQVYLKSLFTVTLISVFYSFTQAFTLIVHSDENPQQLSIAERNGHNPARLAVGLNDIQLNHYPNAVYLLNYKNRTKWQLLPMLWVPSDSSVIEIEVDSEYNVTIKNVDIYQEELNQIFETSNKWYLFPYEPKDDRPLEPILALEAKALIQSPTRNTPREVLENLLQHSQERGIDNWSTEAISKYLGKGEVIFDQNKVLNKIIGYDSLMNLIEIKPENQKHLLVNVTATWCGPCIKGLPNQISQYHQLKEKVDFVSLWKDETLEQFVHKNRDKKQDIVWPSLWDQYGMMAQALVVFEYPTYILFNSSGKEVKRWSGKFPNDIQKYL